MIGMIGRVLISMRRISSRIYNPVRMAITSYLKCIIRYSVIDTEHGHRKNFTIKNVV